MAASHRRLLHTGSDLQRVQRHLQVLHAAAVVQRLGCLSSAGLPSQRLGLRLGLRVRLRSDGPSTSTQPVPRLLEP